MERAFGPPNSFSDTPASTSAAPLAAHRLALLPEPNDKAPGTEPQGLIAIAALLELFGSAGYAIALLAAAMGAENGEFRFSFGGQAARLLTSAGKGCSS
jgi:hypothetical protein